MPAINLWAVLLAAVANFIVGFAWFSPKTFFPVWWRAMGKEGQEPGVGSPPMGVTFGLTFLAGVAQAFGLALVIGWALAAGHAVGWLGGLGIGALAGVLFAAATSLGHRLFAGQGFTVWLIEVGGDIAGLSVMGLIIGGWPPA